MNDDMKDIYVYLLTGWRRFVWGIASIGITAFVAKWLNGWLHFTDDAQLYLALLLSIPIFGLIVFRLPDILGLENKKDKS